MTTTTTLKKNMAQTGGKEEKMMNRGDPSKS